MFHLLGAVAGKLFQTALTSKFQETNMNTVVAFLIQQLADIVLGSDVFTRIVGAVERWADKEISGAEKRTGVLDELEVIGLKLTKSAANFGVELAVQYIRTKA